MAQATQTSGGTALATDSLTPLHWGGIGLAAISGVIHLFLGVSFLSGSLGVPFLVAGVGFFAGIGAILVDYRRLQVALLGVPFTAGQIVLWYVINRQDISAGDVGPIGIVDKVAQVLLIVVLLVLVQRNR